MRLARFDHEHAMRPDFSLGPPEIHSVLPIDEEFLAPATEYDDRDIARGDRLLPVMPLAEPRQVLDHPLLVADLHQVLGQPNLNPPSARFPQLLAEHALVHLPSEEAIQRLAAGLAHQDAQQLIEQSGDHEISQRAPYSAPALRS